jgi:hypothetical protein
MLNRWSAWEWLGLIARRQWRAAQRLGSAPTREFTIGGQRLCHVQYAPFEAASHFTRAGFRLHQVYGFGALRPPHTVRRIPPPVVASLEWLDLRLGGLPPLRAAGRFFVLDLERFSRPG